MFITGVYGVSEDDVDNNNNNNDNNYNDNNNNNMIAYGSETWYMKCRKIAFWGEGFLVEICKNFKAAHN